MQHNPPYEETLADLLVVQTRDGRKTLWEDDRGDSTQRVNISNASRKLFDFALAPVDALGDNAAAAELQRLEDLKSYLDGVIAVEARNKWTAYGQKYQVFLVALNDLKFRILYNVAKIQGKLHNFDVLIMEATGYNFEELIK